MSSPKQRDSSTHTSKVAKFYEGKSLFITGAAGFLGVVLLEALLRCCPDILRIFILLRPKKGVLPEQRKEAIFKKEIFFKLREKNPDVFKKVVVISGDVSRKNLGMTAEDTQRVSEEVTVVFHCAAAISFVKSIRFMVEQNVIGTNNVLELCRKLKKLDVMVYTSTAYSNCNLKCEIEEYVYKLPFTAEEVLKVYKNGTDEELMYMFSTCNPKYPNFYAFAKSISETLLSEQASDLPICIIRPSVIINCMKGSHPGYIEDGSALVSLCIGVGKGFVRVMQCDPDAKTNLIPADVVANTHIVAAYLQCTESLPTPTIYNCVSADASSWTWSEFVSALIQMVLKHPLPKSYQKPSFILCKSRAKYLLCSILDHYAPALVIDTLLWLISRKPRLYKLYRFYDINMAVTLHFRMNAWSFKRKNFESLCGKINATDSELFPVDLKNFTLEGVTEALLKGAPQYRKQASDTPSVKSRSNYMYYYLTPCIKFALLGCIASIFYITIF